MYQLFKPCAWLGLACSYACKQMVWYIVLITYSITYTRMRYLVSILMDPLKIPSIENKYICIFFHFFNKWKNFFDIFFFYNKKFIKQLKKLKKKIFFWQNSKSWFVYFTETEKDRSENELKIIHYVQTWPPDVNNFNWICRPKVATY